MPTYEYRCTTCEHLEEVFAKMSDPPPAACDHCGATTLQKVLHPVAISYKGSGFYSTDYGSRRSGGRGQGEGEGSSGGSGDGGNSSGSGEGGSSGDAGGSSGSSGSGGSGSGSGSSASSDS